MRRRAFHFISATAVLALLAGGCATGDDEAADTTVTTEPDTDVDLADLRAEATEVTVGYFEALATSDFSRARDRSSGSAELAVDWNDEVSSIEAVRGTPYEVPGIPAPDVTVQIGNLVDDNGRWISDGFIELSERPGGVVAATTTAPPTTEGQAPPEPVTNVYVTDLAFERDGTGLVLVDYRYDDVPYPVSDLYFAEGSTGDTTVANGTDTTTLDGATDNDERQVDVDVHYVHRSMNGSVQYLLSHPDDERLVNAAFDPDADENLVDLSVYADDGSDRALVVWTDGFPGTTEGDLEVTFEHTGTDETRTDPVTNRLALSALPELGQSQPLNTVRDREEPVDDTTTTTTEAPEPDDETTITTEQTTTTEPTTTTTTEPTTTTTEPTTTTTMPSG